MLSTPIPVVHPSLKARSERLRAEGDAVPVSIQDLRSAGIAERARQMAIGASGRKHAATLRGDTPTARRERGMERSQLAVARDAEARLAADRSERADKRWIGRVTEETAALESARGETVDRRLGGGLRITSRDGLATLAKPDRTPQDGDAVQPLTSVQYRAGLLYRDIFEGAREQLGSQLGAIQGSARGPVAHDPDRKSWAQRKSELARELVEVEGLVSKATLDPRAVTLLREVAGCGRSLSSLSPSGSRREKDAKLIRTVLDVVAVRFKVSDHAARIQVTTFDTSSEVCAFAACEAATAA